VEEEAHKKCVCGCVGVSSCPLYSATYDFPIAWLTLPYLVAGLHSVCQSHKPHRTTHKGLFQAENQGYKSNLYID